MNAEKGQLLFYSENGLIANTIKKKTNGKYNHCEICIADNVSLEIRPSHIGLIDLFFKELEEGETIDIFTPCWNDINAGILEALKILHETKGYSLGGITAWWSGIERLRKIKDNRFESNEWVICSEVVAKCLEIGRVKKLIDYPNSLFSPNDILKYFEINNCKYLNNKTIN